MVTIIPESDYKFPMTFATPGIYQFEKPIIFEDPGVCITVESDDVAIIYDTVTFKFPQNYIPGSSELINGNLQMCFSIKNFNNFSLKGGFLYCDYPTNSLYTAGTLDARNCKNMIIDYPGSVGFPDLTIINDCKNINISDHEFVHMKVNDTDKFRLVNCSVETLEMHNVTRQEIDATYIGDLVMS